MIIFVSTKVPNVSKNYTAHTTQKTDGHSQRLTHIRFEKDPQYPQCAMAAVAAMVALLYGRRPHSHGPARHSSYASGTLPNKSIHYFTIMQVTSHTPLRNVETFARICLEKQKRERIL